MIDLYLVTHLFSPMADDPMWLILLRWFVVTAVGLALGLSVVLVEDLVEKMALLRRRITSLSMSPFRRSRATARRSGISLAGSLEL